MQTYKSEKSGKMTSTKVTAAHTCTAGVLFVLSILLLVHSQNIKADNGSGMINRAPMVKTTPKPTALEKISTDLDDIIKSINEIPDEVEENTVIAEPEKPVEEKPSVKVTAPTAVIAKPKMLTPAPVKVEAAEKEAENKKVEPVVAKHEQPKPGRTETVNSTQSPVPAAKINSRTAYSKLMANGEKLQNESENWACVVDENNGLMWEVKSSNDDIRDKKHLYTWFDPTQEGTHGVADGGLCKGDIPCDTNAYVQAINKQKLCGHDDWRLPTREEMQSLVYFGNKSADTRINIEYFPQAMPSWYWTASSNANNPDYAWYVLFRNGAALNDLKEHPKHIRLVRADKKA